MKDAKAPRKLIVLVGPDGDDRTQLARRLIARDEAVVLCDGPPGCSLVRGERCAIVDAVDAVVVLPARDGTSHVAAGLALCARDARRAFVLHPPAAVPPAGALFVDDGDPDEIARTIDDTLTRPR